MGKCEDRNRKWALRAAGGNPTANTVSLQWKLFPSGVMPIGLFASMGQMGVGVGIPPPPNSGDDGQRQIRRLVAAAELSSNAQETKDLGFGLSGKYSPSAGGEFGFKAMITQAEIVAVEVEEEGQRLKKKIKRRGLKLRVGNAALKRLLSGAIAGAFSRTAVAPLETIRTHLMVGSSGKSMTEVFNHIMQNEGWQGLFRGNGVNVIRVAPSKAIEIIQGVIKLPTVDQFFGEVDDRVVGRPPSLYSCSGLSKPHSMRLKGMRAGCRFWVIMVE